MRKKPSLRHQPSRSNLTQPPKSYGVGLKTAFGVLVGIAAVVACSGGASEVASVEAQVPSECEAYLSDMGRCFGSKSIEARARKTFDATGKSDLEVQVMVDRCKQSAVALKRSCP